MPKLCKSKSADCSHFKSLSKSANVINDGQKANGQEKYLIRIAAYIQVQQLGHYHGPDTEDREINGDLCIHIV